MTKINSKHKNGHKRWQYFRLAAIVITLAGGFLAVYTLLSLPDADLEFADQKFRNTSSEITIEGNEYTYAIIDRSLPEFDRVVELVYSYSSRDLPPRSQIDSIYILRQSGIFFGEGEIDIDPETVAVREGNTFHEAGSGDEWRDWLTRENIAQNSSRGLLSAGFLVLGAILHLVAFLGERRIKLLPS